MFVRLRGVLALVALAAAAACAHRPPPRTAPRAANPRGERIRLVATAYCQTGKTASGVRVRSGMVAADPRVFPFGTVLRILEPGEVEGTYTVTDTGTAIKGRMLDIFMPDCVRATRFGRRHVVVTVLTVS
jgi:3D (Asp-Asp-Asp) domain-containing protein